MENVQVLLGSHFTGMYLEGSLANGDFDQESDIDFVVALAEPATGERFALLQAMHDRLAQADSPWAIQLEGWYVSKKALRRYDPNAGPVPNIQRGRGERLNWVRIDPSWEVHRYILREKGIVLAGPPPQSLIDLVSPEQLRQASRYALSYWAANFLSAPGEINGRGYQAYIVLSLCRVLYTLRHGQVVSKRRAAHWAQGVLEPRWADLIERAWDGRNHPDERPSAGDVEETLEFIRYVLSLGL
jgi:hypothetical protein